MCQNNVAGGQGLRAGVQGAQQVRRLLGARVLAEVGVCGWGERQASPREAGVWGEAASGGAAGRWVSVVLVPFSASFFWITNKQYIES